MRIVEAPPAFSDGVLLDSDRPGRLDRSGCPPELDEEPVGGVAELEIGGVDPPSLPVRARTRPR